MPEVTRELLQDYLQEVKSIYGDHLKQIILYGSYARGDFNKESDIDIMLLVNLQDSEMDAFADAISELGFEYNVTHDIWIMPVVKNIDHFRYWSKAYPFYANVKKEGIVLYDIA